MLMPEGKVIAYASRELKLHEKIIRLMIKNWLYCICIENLETSFVRWFKLLKDYELVIDYHPGKTNVVADALSRK
ncbi:integrase [Gossypium australe]|uniref:Integrase n=1 Tax=Gossypium australe TaxID=47621 RepID=A0A5B6WT51_9ROSI|nr:integrase [Gossypium australe]